MIPRNLPRIRDLTLKHLEDPHAMLRSRTGEENQAGLDVIEGHLRAAGMYWVTGDMAALAMSSGSKLAAASWSPDARPSPCGLILFDGGLGMIDTHKTQIPVDACTWGPQDGGCGITLWMTRTRLADGIAEYGAELLRDKVPPLIPIRGRVLPVTAEPSPIADLAVGGTVIAALAAAWLLMQQPTIADRTSERADKQTRRAYARTGRPDPDVTVIDLRRQYVPDGDDIADDSAGGRFRHRWVVSGHWRNQPYGPNRSLRRQTWIPAYVKGPDGAPLLMTERVNVWRR